MAGDMKHDRAVPAKAGMKPIKAAIGASSTSQVALTSSLPKVQSGAVASVKPVASTAPPAVVMPKPSPAVVAQPPVSVPKAPAPPVAARKPVVATPLATVPPQSEPVANVAAIGPVEPKLTVPTPTITTPQALPTAVAAPAQVLPAPLTPVAAMPTRQDAKPAVVAEAPAPNANSQKKETIMSTADEFMSQGQATVEAMIKSGQIWATGMQDIGRTMAESAQAQFEHNVATWKALFGTKSVKEAFDIQSSRARAALEKAMADTGKLTDASMKLAEQTMAPIAARLTVTTEKFVRPN